MAAGTARASMTAGLDAAPLRGYTRIIRPEGTMNAFAAAVLAVAFAAPALAAPPPPPVQYEISFSLRLKELNASGNFQTLDGTQVNYVRGGEQPMVSETASGKTVDFKKHGVIVNCLPKSRPDGLVDLQCQFELSGPTAPQTEFKVRPVETFQYQAEFLARPGRPSVLVDEPDRRVEVGVKKVAL
jgi:hypothetical protein